MQEFCAACVIKWKFRGSSVQGVVAFSRPPVFLQHPVLKPQSLKPTDVGHKTEQQGQTAGSLETERHRMPMLKAKSVGFRALGLGFRV